MKKTVAFFLFVFLFVFCGCNNKNEMSVDEKKIILIQDHPKIYGSVQQAKEVWIDIDKDVVVFNSDYTKYSDKSIIVIDSFTSAIFDEKEKDIIRGIEIYFSNFKDNTTTLSEALEVAKSYFPNEEFFEFSMSGKYIHDDTNTYIVSYVLDSSKNAPSNLRSVDFIIEENKSGIVQSLIIRNGKPNWFGRNASSYCEEEWHYDFFDKN